VKKRAADGVVATRGAAIPLRAFKGMSDWSVTIFPRRLWKIVAVSDDS